MNKIEDFFNFPNDIKIIDSGRKDVFLKSILPEESLQKWVKSSITSIGGIGGSSLIAIKGVSLATIPVEGLLGFFGVTAFSLGAYIPIALGALALLAISLPISHSFVKDKQKYTNTPLCLLGHCVAITLWYPVIVFLKLQHRYLDCSLENLLLKVKKMMADMGYTPEYSHFFVNRFINISDEQLIQLLDKISSCNSKLESATAGSNKLYKNELKNKFLANKISDICSQFNRDYCSEYIHLKENERCINKIRNTVYKI